MGNFYSGGVGMSEAPERMWVNWRPGLGVTSGPLAKPPTTEWVRKDVADAMISEAVAEERERCAQVAECARYNCGLDQNGVTHVIEGSHVFAEAIAQDLAAEIRKGDTP
jgi:hypothetical protein